MPTITNYRSRPPGQPVPVLGVQPAPKPPRPPVIRRLDPADILPAPKPQAAPAEQPRLARWAVAPCSSEEKYIDGMNARAMLRVVAHVCGVTVSELRGPCRLRKIARPRQLWMYLTAVHFPRMSLPRVAAILDRDHTTVIHGRNEIERMLKQPERDELRKWFDQCQAIMRRIKGPAE